MSAPCRHMPRSIGASGHGIIIHHTPSCQPASFSFSLSRATTNENIVGESKSLDEGQEWEVNGAEAARDNVDCKAGGESHNCASSRSTLP